MAGTTDLLALELGRLLAPLRRRLADGDLAGLFEELGLPLPANVRNAPAVVTATSAAPIAPAAVTPKVQALAAAIATGQDGQIAAAAAQLVPVAGAAFVKASALASAVKTIFQAGRVPAEFSTILAQLVDRLLGFLIVSYLEGYHPVLA